MRPIIFNVWKMSRRIWMAGYSKIILRKAIIRRWTSLKCIFLDTLLSIVQLNVLALFIFFYKNSAVSSSFTTIQRHPNTTTTPHELKYVQTTRLSLGTPYPLVPPAQISVLTLVPPNPRVLKIGTKNRY